MPTVAANSSGMPGLLDYTKLLNPDGSIAVRVAELLSKRSALIGDAVVQEANSVFGHRVSTRTGLVTPTWRKFGQGIPITNTKEDQFTESVGMLRDWSQVDVEEANLGGQAAAFRLRKVTGKMASMKIEMERAIIYSSIATNPETIQGFMPRLNATTVADGKRIILADATASGSDQASVLLVGWGDETVYLTFPKGGNGGLRTEDMGIHPVNDSLGNPFRAYMTELMWDLGVCVEDFRFIARLANIDTSALKGDASAGAKLIDGMISLTHRIYDLGACKPFFYVNRTINEYLQLQAKNASSFRALTVEAVSGMPVAHVNGVPVHVTDALINTETIIA